MAPRHFSWRHARRAVCGVLAAASLTLWFARPASTNSNYLIIGRIDDYPPGSVTRLRLPVAFDDPVRPGNRRPRPPAIGWRSPLQMLTAARLALRRPPTPSLRHVTSVPIFLVRNAAGEVTVLYDRDPLTACRLDWIAAARRFKDRCSASAYTAAGGYQRGPATRDMDRFAVVIVNGGDLAVDMGAYQAGAFHP